MTYQSLYRNFRPKIFDEVLGQEHITTTLKNQIVNNNIAHAYLFSGIRGTGKTSTAKILARGVNCLNNTNGNPCNECPVCKGILNDSIMDVVEMDAASNNSVEDVRELREKVKYPPSKGNYKVYIIDEVHMLSKGAFNALLKTLEEPPKHLLFILATTEPEKLPATILSRCQRYDFKRITTDDIFKNMKNICNKLGVEVEDKGLRLIARNSDGAMRDALSILDQVVSFSGNSGNKISYDHILSILGTVNKDLMFEIADSIIYKDLDRSLELIEVIARNGKDIHQFIKDLIFHFRNLMIVKSTRDVNENVVDISLEMIDKLKEQSREIDIVEIIRCLNILSEAESQGKWSSQPRIILEISIIKLTNKVTDLSLEGISKRLRQLENMIQKGNIKVNEKKESSQLRKTSQSKNTRKVVKEENTKKHKEDFSGNLELNEISNEWPDISKIIKKEKISLHALLMEGKLSKFENNILTISYSEGFEFHKDAIDKKENREYIEKIIGDFLGTSIKVKFVMEDEINPKNQNNNDGDKLVKKAIDIFGEDLVEKE